MHHIVFASGTFLYETRENAERILVELGNRFIRHKRITLDDLYDICSTERPTFVLATDQQRAYCRNYGWTSMDGFIVTRDESGDYWELEVPEATELPLEYYDETKGEIVTYSKSDPILNSMDHRPKQESDMVNHPAHYKSKTGLETIDVIEAFTADLMGIEATDTGNIIKYICRWKSKNGLQDLEKARWYLDHLINHIKKESDQS